MAEYRYFFADLLTNEINVELPLYGVSLGRVLNKSGNATFSFKLGTGTYDDVDVIEGTAPGRTCLYVERNGALVWGGVVWSRTWQEQSLSFQYTGQTFESFPFKQPILTTFERTNTDQRNILRDLISTMQTDPYANIGIVIPSAFADNITRSVTFNDFEAWTFGKAIDYMINYADGFDYTIEVRYGASGNPEKALITNDELGLPLETTGLVFDYPGNIKNYWYPENASRGATSVQGIGAGQGVTMKKTPLIKNQVLLNNGYPNLTEHYTNKDISDIDTLTNQATAYLIQKSVPITVATWELNPEMEPEFGSYGLGDYARMEIESRRFPGGKTLLTRIVGWDLTPSSSENQEAVKLIVSGEEEAVV